MDKNKLIQTSLLLVIALSAVGICIQNQMILNRLSALHPEDANPVAKKASYAPDRNFTILPVNPDGSINVTLKSSEILNVNIDQVSGYGTYGKVPVEIK